MTDQVAEQLELLNGQVGRMLKRMEVPAIPAARSRESWMTEPTTGPRDLLGRKDLHRLNLASYAKAIPGFAERIRKVPARAVQEEKGDEAFVTCPCGANVVATQELGDCPADCGRHYIYLACVWVVYGALDPPALPPTPVVD